MFSNNLRSLGIAWLLVATPLGASAQVIAEIGDAGETFATAQVIAGPFGKITGTLTNRGNADFPLDDVDLYKINILNTAAFSVTTVTNLQNFGIPDTIDDTMLFLFDADGVMVLKNDDPFGPGLDPIFLPGQLASFAPGTYYLGFDQFPTHELLENGGILAGWDHPNTLFPEFGTYALTFTGTGGGLVAIDDPGAGPRPIGGPVPEPATWAMMILGFGAAGSVLRRRRIALPVRIV